MHGSSPRLAGIYGRRERPGQDRMVARGDREAATAAAPLSPVERILVIPGAAGRPSPHPCRIDRQVRRIIPARMSPQADSSGSPSTRPSRVLMAISHADTADTTRSLPGSASLVRADSATRSGADTNHSNALVSNRIALIHPPIPTLLSSESGSGSSNDSEIFNAGSCPNARGRDRTGASTATGRPWFVIVIDAPVRSISANSALSFALASVLVIVFTTQS